MSNKTQTNKNVSITKRRKTPVWVWFLALVPVISSGIFLLILADMIPFISLDIFYDKPGGGIGWHTSGILVLILTMAAWGACGFLYGFFRAKMSVAVLTANALPILCTVVYTVCIIGAYFGASALADIAVISSIGMGLFSYIDTFIYGIISLGDFGIYLDLIFMLFTFIIGYTIGKSKRFKV
jgi:hypothetical protein